jgi:hypothetical protein
MMPERETTAPQPGTTGRADTGLRRLGPGFYADDAMALYFDAQEFLAAFDLPDTPAMRARVGREVQEDFGVIGITLLSGAEK